MLARHRKPVSGTFVDLLWHVGVIGSLVSFVATGLGSLISHSPRTCVQDYILPPRHGCNREDAGADFPHLAFVLTHCLLRLRLPGERVSNDDALQPAYSIVNE